MSASMGRDFASLLDDLIKSAPPADEETAARPSIPFDIIPPSAALDAFWSSVSSEFVAGLYGEADEAYEVVEEYPELPAVTLEAVSAELALHRVAPRNLDRLRRAFAFKNHPDRVAPELRERALTRMALANRLIDEAKRKSVAKAKA